MKNPEQILEYVAWPIAFVVVAVIFLVLFRKAISGLLEKTQKISKEGIEIAQTSQTKPSKKEFSAKELVKVPDSTTIREYEKRIEEDLDELKISDPNEKIKILTRQLAATQQNLFFSSVEKALWGSQLEILRYLNSNATGVDAEKIKSYYWKAVEKAPEAFAKYGFEKYIQFLIDVALVKKENNQYFITLVGKDFLVYLVNIGQTGPRPL